MFEYYKIFRTVFKTIAGANLILNLFVLFLLSDFNYNYYLYPPNFREFFSQWLTDKYKPLLSSFFCPQLMLLSKSKGKKTLNKAIDKLLNAKDLDETVKTPSVEVELPVKEDSHFYLYLFIGLLGVVGVSYYYWGPFHQHWLQSLLKFETGSHKLLTLTLTQHLNPSHLSLLQNPLYRHLILLLLNHL